MKLLIMILASACLCACSNTPEVGQTSTDQVYDLNDPDLDGVIVARDNCVDTANGALVGNYGCGEVNEFIIRDNLDIKFANNSAYIAPAYFDEIAEVAKFLNDFPDSQVTIEGHCSKVGTHAYNQDLSNRRASGVAQTLIDTYDIDASRVEAIGYSFDRPIDDTHTFAAHKVNRRVIAELVGTESDVEMKWTIWSVDP